MIKRILVVDDDTEFLDLMSEGLKNKGFFVKTAQDGVDGLTKIKTDVYHAVVSDFKMPNMDGHEFLKQVRKIYPDLGFLLLTGFVDLLETDDIIKSGANEVLTKPVKMGELSDKLNNLIVTTDGEGDKPKGQNLDELYQKVTIESILDGQYKQYNRYLRLSEKKYIVFAAAGDDPDELRLRYYRQKGVTHMFVFKEDIKSALDTVKKVGEVIKKKSKQVTPAEKASFVSKSTSIIFSQMQNEEVSEELINHAQENLSTTINVVADMDTTATLFNLLSKQDDILHAHAVGTSVVSSMIAKEFGINQEKNVLGISLGAFLHDIGKTKFEKRLYSTPFHQLTPDEKRIFLTHPQIGYDVVHELKNVPEVVQMMILQHHEDLLGEGYPSGLRSAKITQGAKIIYIASDFCNLTIKNPVYRYMPPSKAIKQLEKTKIRHFDKDVFRALKRVYKVA